MNPDQGYVYDFGHAYMAKGRVAADNREYITPPLDAFKFLASCCFIQGATLKGMGENGADVKGLLFIPGKFTLAEAKTFINSVDGASCLSTMGEVIHNNTGTSLKYTYITITKYEALKALNDAVFFPAASKRNLMSGQSYNSNNKGWYWSSSYVGTTTAGDLYFNGVEGGFMYNGKSSSNSAMSRDQQMAIRLLVEVEE